MFGEMKKADALAFFMSAEPSQPAETRCSVHREICPDLQGTISINHLQAVHAITPLGDRPIPP
jgi:hypothetical protein